MTDVFAQQLSKKNSFFFPMRIDIGKLLPIFGGDFSQIGSEI